jgi:hypothetical protein
VSGIEAPSSSVGDVAGHVAVHDHDHVDDHDVERSRSST